MDDSLYEEMWRTENKHWWFVARRRIVTALVHRFAPTTEGAWKICELGCGTGGNLAEWADSHDVVGVDASPRALEFAQRRLGDRVTIGRLPSPLPLPSGSFDVVLSTDVFEHIEEDSASVESAIELLRPGGVLIATVPAYQWLFSPRDRHHHHFRRYGKRQFTELFNRPTTEVELISHYNSFLFPPAAAARLWSKWFPSRSSSQDVKIPAAPVNRLLTSIFASELHLLRRRIGMPFGLSLVAVVRRRNDVGMTKAA